MERLIMEYCGEYVPKELCSIDRSGNAYGCDLCCEYCKAMEDDSVDCRGCAIDQCFNKLGEYEELEDKGKLLKLPCAVGDTVHEIIKTREAISEFTVIGFSVSEHGIFVKWKLINGIYRNLSGFNDDEIGKTVFLTKEEAEAALKNM